jgi:hypothetical protein
MAPRYAVYFTPVPGSVLAAFGAQVLGYDPFAKAVVPQFALEGISPPQFAAATEAPRRYGFHATLVAPFYLGAVPEYELVAAFDRFCESVAPAPLGRLAVQRLDSFVALVPAAASPQADALAARSVEVFDRLRAPLSEHDLARRDDGDLTPRQRGYLLRWGYPYIFEDFRFHMSLTGALPDAECKRFAAILERVHAPIAGHAVAIDGLSLLRQNDSASRFEIVTRNRLTGR